jgi:hypothetical protein
MVQLLQMNPLHQGAEIIQARSKALRLTKTDVAFAQKVSGPKVERRKLLEQLDSIRAQFWTLPIDALEAKLAELNTGDYADLEAAASRLKVVAAYRGKFPKLARMDRFDGDFFSSLKDVLIRSPRDTAVLREQVLSTFRNRARRKSGRAMVELLKHELPAVYELESNWFETLSRQKAQAPAFRLTSSSRRAQPVAAGTGSGAGRYWWVLAILASSALRAFFSQSDHSNDSRHQPPPTIEYKQYQFKQLPSDAQRMIESGEQRARDLRNGRFPEMDKGVWQPYPSPAMPNASGEPASRPRIKIEQPFAKPRIFDSGGPGKNSNAGPPR